MAELWCIPCHGKICKCSFNGPVRRSRGDPLCTMMSTHDGSQLYKVKWKSLFMKRLVFVICGKGLCPNIKAKLSQLSMRSIGAKPWNWSWQLLQVLLFPLTWKSQQPKMFAKAGFCCFLRRMWRVCTIVFPKHILDLKTESSRVELKHQQNQSQTYRYLH